MPSDYSVKTLNCNTLSYQDIFLERLYESSVDSSLTDKLREFGQTTPLLVLQKAETAYQIIANFAVYQSLKTLDVTDVYCRILPHSVASYRRYSLQVLHGWNELQNSPILRAHLLQQVKDNCTTEELLSILSLMELPSQLYTVDELVSLLNLSTETIFALHHGLLTLKSAKLMHRLSHQDQEYVIKLLELYKPGGSKQYKLLEMIIELTRRMNISVADLVQKWLPMEQDNRTDNNPQHLQNILRELTELCWPEKIKLEEQFLQFVHSLALPKNITVIPSPSFEEKGCSLCLHCSTEEELQHLWNRIRPFFPTVQQDREQAP
ncbi:MAG: hypothetical protein RBQ88_02840 [Desulfobulbus oligotrophicus]|jgi:ParB family chromosome partitioning protein|nr:hypothetical protein [Desulfobulbus oligotrophicus]